MTTQDMFEQCTARAIQHLVDENIAILISITPTSDRRNHYTDAQVHLMAAIDSLRKAGTP